MDPRQKYSPWEMSHECALLSAYGDSVREQASEVSIGRKEPVSTVGSLSIRDLV